jgi:hypothetical protein
VPLGEPTSTSFPTKTAGTYQSRTTSGPDQRTGPKLGRNESPVNEIASAYEVDMRLRKRHATKREMGRCLLVTRAWEPQARGPGHVHPVFLLQAPSDVSARVADHAELVSAANRATWPR